MKECTSGWVSGERLVRVGWVEANCMFCRKPVGLSDEPGYCVCESCHMRISKHYRAMKDKIERGEIKLDHCKVPNLALNDIESKIARLPE